VRAQFFFLFALLSLPIQLNKYFNTPSALVFGIPIDYRTPALYFSDFAILTTIVFFALEHRGKLTTLAKKNLGYILPLSALCFYLLLNSLFSESRYISFVSSLKVLEIALFSIASLALLQKKNIQEKALKVLKISMIWQAALALLQFTFQRSLGLYILGERTFDITTPQIATVNFLGQELLRAYGTFPHPNILAAFLLLGVVVTDQKFKFASKSTVKKSVLTASNIQALLIFLALVVTFSKTTLILTVIYFFLVIKSLRYKILVVVLAILLASTYFLSLADAYINSIAERITLAQAAIKITTEAPFLGVGQNNFIAHLATLNIMSIGQVRLLQPVHNVFLLIFTESGVVGFALFSTFIFKVIEKSKNSRSLFLGVAILTYLSVDHFLWTLHQGLLLLFLTSIFIYNSKKKF